MSDELYEPQAGDSLYRFKCFVYPLSSHKPFDVREGSWVEQVCYRCCEHHARRYLLEVAQAVGFHVRWFELLEKGEAH